MSLHLKFIKYLKNKIIDHFHVNFKAMRCSKLNLWGELQDWTVNLDRVTLTKQPVACNCVVGRSKTEVKIS